MDETLSVFTPPLGGPSSPVDSTTGLLLPTDARSQVDSAFDGYEATAPLFMGIKERRRSSIAKQPHGDYISASRTPAIIKILAKHGKAFLSLEKLLASGV